MTGFSLGADHPEFGAFGGFEHQGFRTSFDNRMKRSNSLPLQAKIGLGPAADRHPLPVFKFRPMNQRKLREWIGLESVITSPSILFDFGNVVLFIFLRRLPAATGACQTERPHRHDSPAQGPDHPYSPFHVVSPSRILQDKNILYPSPQKVHCLVRDTPSIQWYASREISYSQTRRFAYMDTDAIGGVTIDLLWSFRAR